MTQEQMIVSGLQTLGVIWGWIGLLSVGYGVSLLIQKFKKWRQA